MKTIAKAYQIDLDIKKSQFICRIFPVKNSKQAKELISLISEKYSDASHNCSGYICYDGEGYDDDGEPSGTAGRPIINVLKQNSLENILAIVTRYFGGIKLGTGGLVRAYSKSVIEAIAIADIIEMELYDIYNISFTYENIKIIDNEIRNYNITILDKKFEEKISYNIAIGKNKDITPFFEKIKSKINSEYIKEEYLKLDN
ncbi:MAG: YigZ family protein [Methanobrevibacter sp.]|nr:YigZ family protein [Methanobrevibacter sp.]